MEVKFFLNLNLLVFFKVVLVSVRPVMERQVGKCERWLFWRWDYEESRLSYV